ncbi:hypothetical protein [Anaerotruncus rubiinfantis]|uniref:hypothetical protein n=1 Tax=Anaerotruncus rubiinfantis TaxID=1720200 RepID=UPI00189B012B|nr:hypothetical protein [Anaerotruncus rubiinfantis]
MDERTLLNEISKMLEERDQRLIGIIDEKFEKQTADIKDYISKNNVAIGEVLTKALEDANESKNTLYKIIPLKAE